MKNIAHLSVNLGIDNFYVLVKMMSMMITIVTDNLILL